MFRLLELHNTNCNMKLAESRREKIARHPWSRHTAYPLVSRWINRSMLNAFVGRAPPMCFIHPHASYFLTIHALYCLAYLPFSGEVVRVRVRTATIILRFHSSNEDRQMVKTLNDLFLNHKIQLSLSYNCLYDDNILLLW